MQEILPNLFIGDAYDYENNVKYQNGWAVVHACKEPYHRQVLGYTGRAVSKDHPEYLLAYRGDRLILNLVDVNDPNWISPIIIDAALKFIGEKLNDGCKVLVHCNQGFSRSAGIGFLYSAYVGKYHGLDFSLAESEFRKIYPYYNPAQGMRGFIIRNWSKYCQ